MQKISEEGDFDRHSIALGRALGVKRIVQIAGVVAASELKSLLE